MERLERLTGKEENKPSFTYKLVDNTLGVVIRYNVEKYLARQRRLNGEEKPGNYLTRVVDWFLG